VKVITANPEPDSFDSLDKLVAEYDIRIAIHNHGPNALFDKLESVVSAVKGRDKRIGACVDCGHFLRSGEDPVKCVLELNERVYGVHIKDEKETNTPKSDNVVIGKGHLDVVGLFKALKQVKFPADGALSLEYEANPQNPIDDMKACLEVAKEAIAKVG
jgi:sugar phosphate isomerase/epimerase